jgi:glycosidase
MRNSIIIPIFLCLFFPKLNAQILDANPSFPTVNDEVTIIYDATQGNGALVGVEQIYAHTGVITSASTSPTNWLHVQGNWGTVDANVAMINLGNNKHSITINISQFYGFPQGTEVLKLAFVFRNAAGTTVGRSEDGTDIFYTVYPNNGELFAAIFSPNGQIILNSGESFNVVAESNLTADLQLVDDGNVVANQNGTSISQMISGNTEGTKKVELIATLNGNVVKDSIFYTVNPSINIMNPPAGTRNGINYINESTVILQLYAPEKNYVYVLGDFNNWTADVNFYMNRSTDNATWWLQLSNLTPNQRYGFQYFIDGQLRLADPLSTLILDPNNDQNINNTTYPNRHPYPTGKTTGFVSIIHPGAPAFNWQHDNFQAPPKKELMIYELLVRDFVATHNYLTIIDTLNYLQNLGINAIELMPVGEFENNESWGYNPSFHMALDKYYGTPEHFKMFVDACHERGIAVILDIALNHTFGQSPMVNMYWDAANNRTAANNPWFNAVCPHEPFCWGYDMNHESDAVKTYIDIVNKYWITEYHLDGFRFDYTKGFVNNANGFSQTRIDLLKRMADQIWSVKQNAYIILEHWADNAEEKQLSDYGMLLWGNLTHQYAEAGMGYVESSNLSSGVHIARGWNDPHLISYIESHDEERIMFKNLNYGRNTNPNHNVRDINIALDRAQAAAVMMIATPGPKMIWQFGELGYDISIDVPCRVCNKPILWNYFSQIKRKQTYDIYKAMLNLRSEYPTFQSLDFQYSLAGSVKRIKLNHSSMNAVVMANFNIDSLTSIPNFQHTGWWYEYFSGDSINVTDVNSPLNFAPGSYKVYTDKSLQKPVVVEEPGLSLDKIFMQEFSIKLYPNPASNEINVNLNEDKNVNVKIINLEGKIVYLNRFSTSDFKIDINHLNKGNYVVLIEKEGKIASEEFIKL